MLYNTPVIPGKTLLFLDEIQDSADAIKSLWSFKEDFPELHVAAAGSLLEFALKELPSFGVGRIRSLFVYPFSFDEFLLAEGKAAWVKAKQEATAEKPLLTTLHNDLVQHYRTFLMVGGMPASVAAWVTTHDYRQCQTELDDIQLTYYDDFPKYAKKVDPTLLRNTLQSVVMQIGDKFTYSRVDGGYRAEEVKKALALLCDAGIIKRVSHTAACFLLIRESPPWGDRSSILPPPYLVFVFVITHPPSFPFFIPFFSSAFYISHFTNSLYILLIYLYLKKNLIR